MCGKVSRSWSSVFIVASTYNWSCVCLYYFFIRTSAESKVDVHVDVHGVRHDEREEMLGAWLTRLWCFWSQRIGREQRVDGTGGQFSRTPDGPSERLERR